MYLFIEILVVALCIGGVIYINGMNNKYKSDNTGSIEEIVNYFKEKQATSLESGIKIKDLPESISKNSFLLLMVKDKTLIFKKGKYYLNLDK